MPPAHYVANVYSLCYVVAHERPAPVTLVSWKAAPALRRGVDLDLHITDLVNNLTTGAVV